MREKAPDVTRYLCFSLFGKWSSENAFHNSNRTYIRKMKYSHT